MKPSYFDALKKHLTVEEVYFMDGAFVVKDTLNDKSYKTPLLEGVVYSIEKHDEDFEAYYILGINSGILRKLIAKPEDFIDTINEGFVGQLVATEDKILTYSAAEISAVLMGLVGGIVVAKPSKDNLITFPKE